MLVKPRRGSGPIRRGRCAVLERPDRRSAQAGRGATRHSDIVKTTNTRGHRVFAGRLDRHRLGFGEKAVVLALRVADGDFRDWDAIDGWSAQIAAELSRPTVG